MAGNPTLDGDLMFPKDYVTAPELKGRDATVTIKAIWKERLQRKGKPKDKDDVVMSFEETPKKFVCNRTNADTIVSLYGTEGKEWVGKRITLFPTTTTFGRETVDCIRIRPVVPAEKGGKKKAEPEPADEPENSDDPATAGDRDEFVLAVADKTGAEPGAAEETIRSHWVKTYKHAFAKATLAELAEAMDALTSEGAAA